MWRARSMRRPCGEACWLSPCRDISIPRPAATPTTGASSPNSNAWAGTSSWSMSARDFPGRLRRPELPRARSSSRCRRVEPIVIDGLALGVLPEIASELAGRNPLLALVHHPLALEWGLSDQPGRHLTPQRAGRHCLRASGCRDESCDSDGLWRPTTASRPTASRWHVPATIPCRRHAAAGAVCLTCSRWAPSYHARDLTCWSAALATLADLPWRLTIVGDLTRAPPTAAALQADIAHYGLTERITTLGAVSSERLASLYDTADLFVLASYFEGYGMAYAEALAHGLPVIGTNSGAIPETVPDEAGLLVAAGDPAALAEALHRAISDGALRSRLSQGALTAARQLPTWPRSAAIFAGALERLA